MNDQFVVHGFLMAAFGQVVLATSLLTFRIKSSRADWPLIGLLVASALSCTLPSWMALWPVLRQVGLAIVLPLFVVQPVLLWLYVVALSSRTEWRFTSSDVKHFLPMLMALAVSLLIILLPESERQAVLVEQHEPSTILSTIVVVAAFLLMLFWLVQSAAYLTASVFLLRRYRERLKQLFSSTQGRELGWLLGLLFVLGSSWLLSVVFLLFSFVGKSPGVPAEAYGAAYFLLIWFITLWGLRQKPGFDGYYLDGLASEDAEVHPGDEAATLDLPSQSQKYQKSSLDQDAQARIKGKLTNIMEEQKLYLDADLTLFSLAEQLSISPNYLSQTINQLEGMNFFDFVNKWRVEHAKHALKATGASVLDIAMASGFNARSTFYKAFKKETGHAPSEFRKTSRILASSGST